MWSIACYIISIRLFLDNLIVDLCKYIHKLSKDKSKANELAANVKALAELIETRNKYEQKGK